MGIRVLVVDDHEMFRTAICSILTEENDIEVVAEVSDGANALIEVQQHKPDIVLLDISMPGLDGLDAARIIKNADFSCRVIILSMHADPAYVSRAMAENAAAYVLKEQALDDLVDAIRAVHGGERYFSPKLTVNQNSSDGEAKEQDLTARELDVIKMLANGITASEVARSMGVSVKTVETHRSNIYKKLKLHNIVELTHFAIRRGLVPLS